MEPLALAHLGGGDDHVMVPAVLADLADVLEVFTLKRFIQQNGQIQHAVRCLLISPHPEEFAFHGVADEGSEAFFCLA